MTNKNCIHVCTVNTNGLQKPEKRNRIIEWANQQKCDIVFLQETHFTQTLEPKLKQEFKGEVIFSNGLSNARGVAIWIKSRLNFKIIDQYKDSEGRFILVNIEIDDNIYTLVNLYAPNNCKIRNTVF